MTLEAEDREEEEATLGNADAVGAVDELNCRVSSSLGKMEKVLILDFGSQYSHLIVRRFRELHLYSELKRCDIPFSEIVAFQPKAVVLSGGPFSVYAADAPHVCKEFWRFVEEKGIAVLGICYGLQEMVEALGGKVEPSEDKREFGMADMRAVRRDGRGENIDDPLLKGVLGASLSVEDEGEKENTNADPPHSTSGGTSCGRVWMSHGDRVTRLPAGFEVVAETSSSEFAVVRSLSRRLWGLQFHPEVTHTENGSAVLANFALHIAQLRPSWDMRLFAQAEIERLRTLVGSDHHVIGAVSGGVDSTVAAALMCKAVGSRFHAFTIDTGLLRKNEGPEVLQRLKSHIPDLNLTLIDASERFLAALKGVTDPEEKRKVIGRKFIEEFEAAVERMAITCPDIVLSKSAKLCNTYLLQGTLYPDVIESVSFRGPSHTIKTHHNVGGLPRQMKLKVLEPLRELFKDEVRKLGEELGIDRESVWRHPFPGPGLGIRILGEVTKERADILREADAIFIDEIRKSGEYGRIGQALVVLLPETRSVGVMGDCRTYEMTAILRAVCTTDYMTADWYKLDYAVLGKVSSRIINEVKGINRVCYDLSSKPPSTIEWE